MSIAEEQKPPPGALYLDHVSHFVPDIDAACRLLESLGFVVTPLSAQQASGTAVGASNRCVMLSEGYLEILTPTQDTPTARRMRERMARFVGVHLACFGTPDAEAEHRRLQDHGFAPEPLVELSRPVDEGNTVRFRVVRPAPDAMPEGRIQYVQQTTPEHIWLSKYLAHDSGVTALRALHVAAEDVPRAAARWSRFTALLPSSDKEGVVLRCARGKVAIRAGREPALVGYALACENASAFAKRCSASGLHVVKNDGGYTVSLPPALGGTWILEKAA